MTITLYTTEPCGFCASAKSLLAKRGVEWDEVNLSKDPVGRVELAERTGLMTFPQIVVDGTTVGGMRELLELDGQGDLAEGLAAVAAAAAGSS
jgi:glutaredoxin 3